MLLRVTLRMTSLAALALRSRINISGDILVASHVATEGLNVTFQMSSAIIAAKPGRDW